MDSIWLVSYDTGDYEGGDIALRAFSTKIGADCFVKKEKNEHFEMVQKNIWLPGMKKIKGMLGGEFSKAVNNTSRYLISTFWDSVENHNNYTKHELPKFKIKSNVKDDIDQITGRQILLVDAWKIIKKDTV